MPTNAEQSAVIIPAGSSEYSAALFHSSVRTSPSNRKCNVSLNEDVYLAIKRTFDCLGDGKSTMGGYVEDTLLSHLDRYKEIFNEETSRRLK